ncbi:MAG: transposase [Brasilonema angustatum HA4187-MV1]|jgi:IS605 OrfB family transposase|nr:transposase [Brasilonema angustatum HA4187-MV1]
MQLVEKHVINRNHRLWKECDQLAFKSKDLYNAANYIQRQYFFDSGKYHTLPTLYHLIKNHQAYKALPTKVSKQICKVLCQAWTGFMAAMKAWRKDIAGFLGKPRLPGYKHKTDGRNIVIYPDESVSIPGLRKGFVVLSQCSIKLPTKTSNVDQVRIVPQKTCYVIEIIYSKELVQQTQGYSAALDVGLSNLMTATSNNPGVKPLVVNGKPLKSINQLFNKRKAQAQSQQAHRQVLDLVHKRNNRVSNYLHTASRRVIDWCLASGISRLIVGKNDRWKQDINIGKSNNQQFTAVPHTRLIQMLEYKGALVGIKVMTTEEAYTSKASALDGDALPKYREATPRFSGKRIKRGLYRSGTGRFINADVNGSLNIGRKVIPDFMKGIEGLPFIPVVVDPLRMHLTTSA